MHAATHTRLEDRLSAHVLYFCLCDIAAGQQPKLLGKDGSLSQLHETADMLPQLQGKGAVLQLLSCHIDQLAKDLNLLLRRKLGPGPGLHTLLR